MCAQVSVLAVPTTENNGPFIIVFHVEHVVGVSHSSIEHLFDILLVPTFQLSHIFTFA